MTPPPESFPARSPLPLAEKAVGGRGRPGSDRRRRTATRAIVSILVLAAEAALFRARFTTEHLKDAGLWWTELLRNSRDAVPVVACAGLAVALFAGRPLAVRLRRATRLADSATERARALAIHVGGLAAFWGTSVLLLSPGGATMTGALAVFAGWVAAAVLLAVGAIGWVWPLRAVASAIRPLRFRLVAAVVVGTLAWLLGSRLLDDLALWRPLGRATIYLADGFLRLWFDDVQLEPARELLGLGDFRVRVGWACSGYDGLLLFPTFFGTFLFVARRRFRFPRVLWLLPLGALAVWLFNGVRIAVLVAIGHLVSPEVALQGFHVHAGWAFFAAVALLCVALATRLPWFARGAAAEASPEATASPAPYVAPLVAATAAVMLVRSLWLPTGLVRAAQILVVALLVLQFRDTYGRVLREVRFSAVLIGLAGAVAWILLRNDAAAPPSWLTTGPAGRTPGFWLGAMLSTVGYLAVAPLVEELAFRGYLLRRLTARRFDLVEPRQSTALAVVVSSLLFGGLHGQWLAATACGALFAFAYRRTGRLGDAVLAHATTNLSLLVAGTWAQRWEWIG